MDQQHINMKEQINTTRKKEIKQQDTEKGIQKNTQIITHSRKISSNVSKSKKNDGISLSKVRGSTLNETNSILYFIINLFNVNSFFIRSRTHVYVCMYMYVNVMRVHACKNVKFIYLDKNKFFLKM